MSAGLERAHRHLAAAAAELDAACRAWGVWADEVREQAEKRLGAGPGDLRVCSDPVYAAALEAGGPFLDAGRSIAQALARAGCQVPGSLAGSGSQARKRAIGSPHP